MPEGVTAEVLYSHTRWASRYCLVWRWESAYLSKGADDGKELALQPKIRACQN